MCAVWGQQSIALTRRVHAASYGNHCGLGLGTGCHIAALETAEGSSSCCIADQCWCESAGDPVQLLMCYSQIMVPRTCGAQSTSWRASLAEIVRVGRMAFIVADLYVPAGHLMQAVTEVARLRGLYFSRSPAAAAAAAS
jgi:hypothetical protein